MKKTAKLLRSKGAYERQYNEACDMAWKARDEACATARKTYGKACDTAWKARDEAMAFTAQRVKVKR